MNKFDEFLRQLAGATLPANCFNLYATLHATDNSFNQLRHRNLRLYLQQMKRLVPTTLLVGEAPGYRGCRLTGIPFVSPAILKAGIKSHQLFGEENGYQPALEWTNIQHEASSTMVWGGIETAAMLPLLWNAFPFHPHKPQNQQSNRPPTGRELALGRPFLIMLLELFKITACPLEGAGAVIAVGNKADEALSRWQIPHSKIRHPSHGGKAEFMIGLRQNGVIAHLT